MRANLDAFALRQIEAYRVALDRLLAAGLLKAPTSAGRRAVVRGLTSALGAPLGIFTAQSPK